MLAKLRTLLGLGGDSTALVVSFEPKAEPPPDAGVLALRDTPAVHVEVYKPEHVGGKGANLLKLRRAGAPVPAFLVVPTAECERALQRARDAAGQGATPAQIAQAVLAGDLSKSTVEMVKAFVGPDRTRAFAVRSSADAEDGTDSAFAGQFETHLNVHTPEHVCDAIKKCFASLFSDNVQSYLTSRKITRLPLMAVVVMEQIDSAVAGVYFQANPVTGATSTHVVNAAPGQGEGVVSGLVQSDEFWLSSADGAVKKRIVPAKTKRIALAEAGGDGTREIAIPEADQAKPALSDAQLLALFRASQAVSRAFHSPQDVEWAFDAAGNLFVLQSRPITTRLERVTYAAPNVGLWRLNAHVSIPMSKMLSPVWCRGWGEGVLWLAQNQTGSGFTAVDTADINGFGYFCMRMPGPKEPPKKAPPAFFLRNMLRLVGRKDAKTAQAFFRDKNYLQFVEKFRTELKPMWIAKHRAIQAEDPAAMDDAKLADYVEKCRVHLDEAYYAHVVYTLAMMLPHAWFVHRCVELAKCDPQEAYSALEGFSPVTEGIKGEFKEEVTVLSKSDKAMAILKNASTSPEAKLAEMEKLTAEEGGDAYRRIARDVENRLVEGYDPANPIVKENPRLLVSGLVNAVDALANPKPPVGIKVGEELRKRIPAEFHAEYDAQLIEMRNIAFLRDERALYTDLWAAGIMHRAAAAAADRLVATNKLAADKRALVLEASVAEMVAALKSSSPVPEAQVAEWQARHDYRFSASIRDAPPLLGGDHDISLTRDHFPTEYMWRSYITSIESVRAISTPTDFEEQYAQLSAGLKDAKNAVFGLSGSAGVVEGVARVVRTANDCASVQQGEVIVTESPSSLINLVLPLASAIVCDFGAVLSHAAVCAREQRIPCVIGTKVGTVVLKTGDKVRVDGTKGVVEVLSSSS